jgi:hypothetical protein
VARRTVEAGAARQRAAEADVEESFPFEQDNSLQVFWRYHE